MAGGDRAKMEMSVDASARAIVTTQAAEKIYRCDGTPTLASIELAVAAGGSLVWAPQETLLFEGADLRRRMNADVAPDASLLIAEATVFGRLAHGEARIDAAFHDSWRIRRGGNLAFAEELRFENAGTDLDRRAIGAGARAIATLLWVDRQAPAKLDALRAALSESMDAAGERLEAGASALDGLLVARFASPAPHRVRAGLVAALRVARGREAPRVWA